MNLPLSSALLSLVKARGNSFLQIKYPEFMEHLDSNSIDKTKTISLSLYLYKQNGSIYFVG